MRTLCGITLAVLVGVNYGFADDLEIARRNGSQANEALVRSRKALDAWWARRDPVTGLLPRSGKEPAWYVRDSAADLFPFLALAARFTDRPRWEAGVFELLRDEVLWSTRVGALSDDVPAGGKGFVNKELDMDRLIYGSCEYAKDGLLPLVELTGEPAFLDRLIGIAEAIINQAPYIGRFGRLPSREAEVNGQFLQVLSRLAWRTADPWYVDQAVNIARFYFEEVIPKSGGLPAHEWDLGRGAPAVSEFHFNDHGNEIAGGLGELMICLKETGRPQYETLAPKYAALVDRLLEVGLNADGVWITSCRLDGEPLDTLHAHCWGYLFNAVYSAWLLTGDERYLAAVKRAMQAVTDKPAYLDDPAGGGRGWGSDAYSDAIESAIVLLNRLPDPRTELAVDSAVVRMLGRQRSDGIVEDWYGDGNYVRTALMYALMKSKGCWIEDWRPDLALGAAGSGDEGLVLAVESESPWSGRLHFDYPRHRLHWNMTVNYPRLNEWPEWFTVEPNRLYEVQVGKMRQVYSGAEMIRGILLSTGALDVLEVRVTPLGEPPYGDHR
ncbi:MAG: hypothetical protein V1794_19095 [Candidatus Glassbacteria bacterium]